MKYTHWRHYKTLINCTFMEHCILKHDIKAIFRSEIEFFVMRIDHAFQLNHLRGPDKSISEWIFSV